MTGLRTRFRVLIGHMSVDREHGRELTGIPRSATPDMAATPGKQTLVEAAPSPSGGEPASRPAAGTDPAPIAVHGVADGAGRLPYAERLRACFGRSGDPAEIHSRAGAGEHSLAPPAASATPLGHGPTRDASPSQPATAFAMRDGAGNGDSIAGPGDRSDELPYRRDMEAAFNADFSRVGVRTGRAGELASINAKASATGEEISFADSQPDRCTVAHELVHVMQHRRHGAGSGGISQPGDAAEREAEAIATAVDAGQPAPTVNHPAVTRSEVPTAGGPVAPTMDRSAATRSEAPADGGQGAPAMDRTAATHSEAPAVGSGSPAVHEDRVADRNAAAAASGATGAPQPAAAPDVATAHTAAGGVRDEPLPHAVPGASPTAPSSHAVAPVHGPASAHALGDRSPAQAPERGEPGAVRAATRPVTAALQDTRHAFDELSPGVRLSELDTAARQVAQRVAVSCEAARNQPSVTPRATPLSPRGEAPPPRARPGTPAPRGHVPTRIEHTPVATEPHPARPDGISAGPRPSVPLRRGSDPGSVTTALGAGQQQIDARLAASHEHSTADHGASRLAAPVHRPVAPAPVPALELPAVAVPAIPESGLRTLRPEQRARIDQQAAPMLDRKLAAVTAAATADHERATAELAALHTDHAVQATARTEAAHARVAALRSRGTAQVDAVRGQWQARSQAVRDEVTGEAHTAHAAMHAEVQGMVRDGEQRSGVVLAEGESRAGARKASADARAASIRADAEARAAGARATPAAARSIARRPAIDPGNDGGGTAGTGNEDQAREILRLAQLQVEAEMAAAKAEMAALLAEAGKLSADEIKTREDAIAKRIDDLKTNLDQTVKRVLGDRFPRLEAAYVAQIDTLLGDIRNTVDKVAEGLSSDDAAAASKALAAASELLDRRSKRLNETLDDVATLSSFQDGDVDKALAAFGITTPQGNEPGSFKDNPKTQGYDENLDLKQDILFEAIRVENKFRAVDKASKKGLLATPELSKPGAAFKALFNEGQGMKITRSTDAGGLTPGPDQINLGGLNPDQTDWIANAKQFQIGHEFGHAFNFGMIFSQLDTGSQTAVPYQHQYSLDGVEKMSRPGAFDTDPVMLDGQLVAGGDPSKRYTPPADLPGFVGYPGLRKQHLDEIEAGFAGQGMRYSKQGADSDPTSFYTRYNNDPFQRGQPYQQDLRKESGEWFADVFVNWANGTLADNAQGDAIDTWMNDHMEDWIEMGLAANKVKSQGTAKP
jgi:hypothetical protein